MIEPRLILADHLNKEVDFALADLTSYTDNGTGVDVWVKDDNMFDGKRFYILAISMQGFEKLLNKASDLIS